MAMEASTFGHFRMINESLTQRDLIVRSAPAVTWREVLRTYMAKSAPHAGLVVIHVARGFPQRRSCTASVRTTRTQPVPMPCPLLPAFIPLVTDRHMEAIIPARADCPAQLSTLVDLGIGA